MNNTAVSERTRLWKLLRLEATFNLILVQSTVGLLPSHDEVQNRSKTKYVVRLGW